MAANWKGEEFIGAIRVSKDNAAYNDRTTETWNLTADPAELASLPDEDVIFVSDVEALQASLDERYGTTVTGLRRTDAQHASVIVREFPVFNGREPAELERHLAECDTQLCVTNPWAFSPEKIRDTNIVIRDNVARLDEKRAKARRKNAQTRLSKKAITIQELRNFGHAITQVLSTHLSLYHFQVSFGGNISTGEITAPLLRLASLFNAAYGENAHRKLAAFQHLCKEWLARPDVNEKAFEKTVFGTWLAREAKETLPEPQTAWSVPDVAAGLEPVAKPAEAG